MNTRGLSLNTIPPISIPLRFFLTAPLFGILAALLFIYHGPLIWSSRWTPDALALTHLLTLGFMLMVMIGALYQFIPVMLGELIPGGQSRVTVIHLLLITGVVALTSGFVSGLNILYWLAFAALGLSLSLFALSLSSLLISKLKGHLIVFLIRVLFFVLLVTIGLGLLMLFSYASPESGIVYRYYTNTHALWGLIGWVVVLIMAVSSQVIPMFFVTPEFSRVYLKSLSLLIISTLAAFYLATDSVYFYPLSIVLSAELSFFVFYTLFLISRRKRKIADVTISFFRLSLAALLLVVFLWWLAELYPELSSSVAGSAIFAQFAVRADLAIGLLLIYGFAISAIIGMLQKIVPFLIYLNLQKLSLKHPESMSAEPKLIPNMKQLINNRQSKIQLRLHFSSLLLLFTSIYVLPIVWLAAVMMLANFIWLSYILFSAFATYLKNKRAILQFPEMKMDFAL